MELSSLLPPQLDDTAAPLIPKKSGGLRDLVVLPGFIRVCSKARAPYCKQWEHDHERSYFAAGSNRAATDVVWRAGIRCEAAQETQQAAAILWDLASYFQMIRHRRLLLRASSTGFPLPICRLAIRLYRAKRFLKLGCAVAENGIRPNRGVAPGCNFACTLIKVYCLEGMDAFVENNRDIDTDMYIDDLQLARVGCTEQVVQRLVEAADELHFIINA